MLRRICRNRGVWLERTTLVSYPFQSECFFFFWANEVFGKLPFTGDPRLASPESRCCLKKPNQLSYLPT